MVTAENFIQHAKHSGERTHLKDSAAIFQRETIFDHSCFPWYELFPTLELLLKEIIFKRSPHWEGRQWLIIYLCGVFVPLIA